MERMNTVVYKPNFINLYCWSCCLLACLCQLSSFVSVSSLNCCARTHNCYHKQRNKRILFMPIKISFSPPSQRPIQWGKTMYSQRHQPAVCREDRRCSQIYFQPRIKYRRWVIFIGGGVSRRWINLRGCEWCTWQASEMLGMSVVQSTTTTVVRFLAHSCTHENR